MPPLPHLSPSPLPLLPPPMPREASGRAPGKSPSQVCHVDYGIRVQKEEDEREQQIEENRTHQFELRKLQKKHFQQRPRSSLPRQTSPARPSAPTGTPPPSPTWATQSGSSTPGGPISRLPRGSPPFTIWSRRRSGPRRRRRLPRGSRPAASSARPRRTCSAGDGTPR